MYRKFALLALLFGVATANASMIGTMATLNELRAGGAFVFNTATVSFPSPGSTVYSSRLFDLIVLDGDTLQIDVEQLGNPDFGFELLGLNWGSTSGAITGATPTFDPIALGLTSLEVSTTPDSLFVYFGRATINDDIAATSIFIDLAVDHGQPQIPEPGAITLVGLGLAALFIRRRKQH